MAQKFGEVTGLYKVFAVNADNTGYDTSNVKDSITALNFNSILFISAEELDELYGYKYGQKYIWTRGKFYTYGGPGLSVQDALDGYNGFADASSFATTIIENELIVTKTIQSILLMIGANEDFLAEWNDKFPEGTTIVEAITYVLDNYDQLANELSDVELAVARAFVEVANSVGLEDDLTINWNLFVDGTSVKDAVESVANDVSILDILVAQSLNSIKNSVGLNLALENTSVWTEKFGNKTISEVVIELDSESSDENVLDTSSNAKAYLLGHSVLASTSTALSNASVYMENGGLHASTLAVDTVNGDVEFTGSVEIDSLTLGDLQVNGGATFVNPINGDLNGDASTVSGGHTVLTDVPANAVFTDEKVKNVTSNEKAYVLAQTSTNNTSTAVTNASVYMQNGGLNVSALVSNSYSGAGITSSKTDITSDGTKIVRSQDIYNYLADTYLNAGVQYLGTVSSSTSLIKSNPSVGIGDFYRVSSEFAISGETAHVGDIVISTKDKPTKITSEDWDILHTENDSNTWRPITINNGSSTAYGTQDGSTLDVSSLSKYVKVGFNNKSVTINASTGTLYDASNGAEGLALIEDLYPVIKNDEETVALLFNELDSKIENLEQDQIKKYGTATRKNHDASIGIWNVSSRMQTKTHGFIIETAAVDSVNPTINRRNYIRSSLSDMYVHSDNQLHINSTKALRLNSDYKTTIRGEEGVYINATRNHSSLSLNTVADLYGKSDLKLHAGTKIYLDAADIDAGRLRINSNEDYVKVDAYHFRVHAPNNTEFYGSHEFTIHDINNFRIHAVGTTEIVNNSDLIRIVNHNAEAEKDTKVYLGRHRAIIGVDYTHATDDVLHPSSWIDTGIIISKDAGIRFFENGVEIQLGVPLKPIDEATTTDDGATSAYEIQGILRTISAALNNLNTRLEAIENNIDMP